MIREVVFWLAAADIAAAAALGLAVYVIGRRSRNRVPASTAVGLAIALAVPAVVIYGLVWLASE